MTKYIDQTTIHDSIMQTIHPDAFAEPVHDSAQIVIAYASDKAADYVAERHTHPRGQLLHIVSGTLAVETGEGTFVVPSERAVWLPAGVVHAIRARSAVKIRTIYIQREATPLLPTSATVVHVTPLLRELILALMASPRNYDAHSATGRLAVVLIDQIALLPVAPLHLPMPEAGRLRSIAVMLLNDPADRRTLTEIAAAAALSARTFERRFRAQTGMTFRAWRRQAKLLKALELLADGQQVNMVAEQLGYETASAFIEVFRRAFGISPGRYFKTE